MQIHFRGCLMKGEFIRAQYLHNWSKRKATLMLVLIWVISLAATLFLDATLFKHLAPIVAIVSFLMLSPWWIPFLQVSVGWKRNPLCGSLVEGSISQDGIDFHSKTYDATHRWDLYPSWTKGHDIALLYIAPNSFTIMPRSYFSTAAEWKEFISLCDQNIRG
jgi:hypothetical protein